MAKPTQGSMILGASNPDAPATHIPDHDRTNCAICPTKSARNNATG